AAFGVMACTSNPSAPGPIDARAVVAPGELVDIGPANATSRFQGVTTDSRCPSDVVCIQAGDAIVRIDVLMSGAPSSTYDLHVRDGQPVRHRDLTIAVENLSPYPISSRPIAPGEYRATLRVRR